jgi:hypothetical protein
MGGAWPTRAVLACSALLAFAAPAHASTQIGMTATSDADNCTPNTEFMQNTVGTAMGFTPSYDVPSSGVITSWSTKPGPSTGTGARLKVYRPTADPHKWTVVGESAAKVPLTPDTLNTANTRIPVQAGDRIAIRTASGNGGPCDFPYPAGLGPGYALFSFQAMPSSTDPPAGSSVTFSDDGLEELVNIAAVVEPDADGDGFGDETQDHCPGVAGSNNGCPPPVVVVPPPTEPQIPILAPKFTVKTTQHVLEQHGIVLNVRPNVASTVTGTATLNLPKGAAVIRFKRASKKVGANAKVTLKLALTKAQLKRVKAALKHHKLTAKAVLTTTASGQKASVKRFSIRLRS